MVSTTCSRVLPYQKQRVKQHHIQLFRCGRDVELQYNRMDSKASVGSWVNGWNMHCIKCPRTQHFQKLQ